MIIEYDEQAVFTKSLDIVDSGNFSICAVSEECANIYYAIVKTVAGITSIIKFGPVIPDTNIMDKNFSMTYKNCKYNEGAILREIATFINDPKKKITDIEETIEADVFNNVPSIEATLEEMD